MEDEIDIYADLPNINLGDNENLAEKNKKLSEKCSDLEKQVADLTQSLESLRKINNNLEVNLSSLLQTAKAEIARKDRMIAEIRRQLDDMQFRRGEHAKPSIDARPRSPSRRRRKHSPEERKRVQEPEVPDKTEFVCGDVAPQNTNDDGNTVKKPRQLDNIVSTVFGERLRKRILEEQEEERKQQAQYRARAEPQSKKITESNASKKIGETDAQSGSKPEDSLKIDYKVKLRIKGDHCDWKRQSEDNVDSTGSRKKFKSNEGESRHRDRSHSNKRSKNASESKSKDQNSAEIDVETKFHVVDEYSAPEGDLHNVGNDDSEDRHNRVAIRLMLLAEGIDPDVERTKTVENGEKKIVGDKRENGKRREAKSRSRSKSRNRRHNHRSRSRTPDQHHRSRRRSRQRDDRPRRSRDRFEKRRDLKNKDGDNLSEFTREIHELKERIEHKFDDGSGNRAEKGTGSNRLKRNDERICKGGKSRTPDSSKSGSQEGVHRSKVDKQSRRSLSRERHGSRNRGHRYSKDDDIPTKHSKTEIPRTEKTEVVEVLPPEVSTRATENPETKSLVSLEDGEIVDSVQSSPVKVVLDPVRSSIDKVVPPRFNLLDSDELVPQIIDLKPLLPSREIGNSQANEKPQPMEKPVLPIRESNQPLGTVNETLNSSKDEKIENIAEFIANFPSNTPEFKKDEQRPSEKITDSDSSHEVQPDAVDLEKNDREEKVEAPSITRSEASPEDDPVVLPPAENSNVLNTNPVTCNSVDNDWCLIAIDSPIKNFEENRKNRMIAQSVQKKEEPEVPVVATTDDEPLMKQLSDTSETPGADDEHRKKDSEDGKVASDKSTKPVIQSVKIISRSKPTALKSLRSTYHKGRKEIVLSDTNSEQCTKVPTPSPVNPTTKQPSNEYEIVPQNKEETNKPGRSGKMEKSSSQKDYKKPSVVELFGDENDSKNVADDKETVIEIKSDIISRKTVDEKNKNSGKSKAKNSKARNTKPELRNSTTKESKRTSGKTTASKTDETKSIGSTKSKTVIKDDKTDDKAESDNGKCLQNGSKPAVKSVSKGKAEGGNSKHMKEPQKLIVARRRKLVHLEDSLTSSTIVASPKSLSDTVDDFKKTASHDDVKLSNTDEENSETLIDQSESETQTIIARNDDHQSEFCSVEEDQKLPSS